MNDVVDPEVIGHNVVAAVLSERGKTHGDYSDHAALTQNLKDMFETYAPSFSRMSAIEKEAVAMILHKLGRVGAGDPHFKDHWVDIAGYAQLVADRL